MPFSLSLLKARAPHSPVIIVGTHSDRLPLGKSAELKAAYRTRIQDLYLQPGGGYPEVNRIMEVSATTKEGTYVHMYMSVSVPKLVQLCLLASQLGRSGNWRSTVRKMGVEGLWP